MKASIQPLVGVLRVHPDDDGCYTKYSSYTFAATIEFIGDEAIILGVNKSPSFKEASAVRRELRKLGVATVVWERSKEDKVKIVRTYIGTT